MELNKFKRVKLYLKTLFFLCFIFSFVFFPLLSFHTSASGTMTKIAIFQGEGINQHYGFRGSGRNFRAADIDKDGYPDIIVGARHHPPDGGVYIFKASTSLTDKNASSADIILRNYNAADGHLLGADITVGDIDDDDINELIIGDYSYSSYAGVAFIFKTGASFVSTTTATADARITGTASSYSSMGLGFPGDVNGDGYKDYFYRGNSIVGDENYIFYGSETLTSKSVSQADLVFTDSIGACGDGLGSNIASEADLNNDGYKDIIFSCGSHSANGGLGVIYIFYGGNSLTDKNLSEADAVLSSGSSSIWLFGREIMTADLNNDGYEDIIAKDDHEVYIFYGSANWTNKTTNEADAVIYGDSTATADILKGGLDIADINNDGYEDIITTAYYSSEIYVFYGSATRIETQYASSADLMYDGSGDNGVYVGEQIEAGDFNKDGNLEIAVTDPQYKVSGDVYGAVFVFTPDYGSPSITIDNDGGTINRKITGIATDIVNVGGVEYSVDNGDWLTGCTADDGVFNSTSENYSCVISSSISDGPHTIRVRSKNADGLYMLSGSYGSATFSSISYGGGIPMGWYNSPKPPVDGFGVTINNGAEFVTNAEVMLSLRGGSDTSRMAISNSSDFKYANQENYTTTKTWNLCGENSCPAGVYTVYAKFYTSFGVDSEVVSDTIILKTGTSLSLSQNHLVAPFTKQLSFLQQDIDVKRLQIFLNQDPDTQLNSFGPGSPGKETDFFCQLTLKAVIKFQEKYAKDILAPWNLIKGTGFVGKNTLAKINQLLGF